MTEKHSYVRVALSSSLFGVIVLYGYLLIKEFFFYNSNPIDTIRALKGIGYFFIVPYFWGYIALSLVIATLYTLFSTKNKTSFKICIQQILVTIPVAFIIFSILFFFHLAVGAPLAI